MAADHLPTKIANFLSQQHDQTSNLNDIVKALALDKKCINKELYKMQRQGAIEKVQDCPPVWRAKHFGGSRNDSMHGGQRRMAKGKACRVKDKRVHI